MILYDLCSSLCFLNNVSKKSRLIESWLTKAWHLCHPSTMAPGRSYAHDAAAIGRWPRSPGWSEPAASEGLIDPMGFFGGKPTGKARWNKWCAFRITIWWLWCDDSDDSSHESKDSKACAYHWIMCHGSRTLQRCPNAHLQSLLIDVQEGGLRALKCWLLTSLFLIGTAIILGLTNPHPFWDFTKAVATIFSRAQRAGRSQLSGACGENTPSKNVVWNWINIYMCVCVCACVFFLGVQKVQYGGYWIARGWD